MNITNDFEKLGVFYLGRRFDLSNDSVTDDLVLYDSKDLLTHAVCIGMTGSGKTGLCLDLVEEAAIDSIPVIAIDPKGDISNLLLTFPELSPAEFQPWVSADDARRSGQTVEQFAAQQASAWEAGLALDGQDRTRIKRLKDAAEFKIFTPGSTAGLPISIVQSLAAPDPTVIEDPDALRERVVTTANCLLSLLGANIDPLKSREHILLSNILERAWRQGVDLNLAQIIQQIQKPSITQVGAIDIESFYPAKERFELAMSVNNLLAAPGFDAWLSGEALDIGKLLHNEQGKPQVSIFSIAHLGDAERMFFVTLLLGQIVSWMRSQSGTSSLRAILYMDEIFGYFPPVANPPSKTPLLTLLKQARAYGLGLVLATQNPVDLDYKGLSNAGTWFIGRLQTERDKARVIDGLEGAVVESGRQFNRQEMESILAGLGKRVFLMNNVHESQPEIFKSRWTLSYMRGPLMKQQIKTLMEPLKNAPAPMGDNSVKTPNMVSALETRTTHGKSTGDRPVVPPSVRQYFLTAQYSDSNILKPYLFATGTVRFLHNKTALDETVTKAYICEINGDGSTQNWSDARLVKYSVDQFDDEPPLGAKFLELPIGLAQASNYKNWSKSFAAFLAQNQKYYLLRSNELDLTSRPGESDGEFRVRFQQRLNEYRDECKEKLSAKYAPKLDALRGRITRTQWKAEKQSQASRDDQLHGMISVGTTIFGAMMSRKPFGSTTFNKASRVARKISRASQKKADVEETHELLDVQRAKFDDLNNQFEEERQALSRELESYATSIQTIAVAPKKGDVLVTAIALLWLPH